MKSLKVELSTNKRIVIFIVISLLISLRLISQSPNDQTAIEFRKIGVDFSKAGEYAKAIDLYNMSFDTALSSLQKAKALSNMAYDYNQLGYWLKSDSIFKEAINLLSVAEIDSNSIAMTYFCYASSAYKVDSINMAQMYYHIASLWASDSQIKKRINININGLFDSEDAIIYFESTPNIHSYKNLYLLYKDKGNFERALKYHVLYLNELDKYKTSEHLLQANDNKNKLLNKQREADFLKTRLNLQKWIFGIVIVSCIALFVVLTKVNRERNKRLNATNFIELMNAERKKLAEWLNDHLIPSIVFSDIEEKRELSQSLSVEIDKLSSNLAETEGIEFAITKLNIQEEYETKILIKNIANPGIGKTILFEIYKEFLFSNKRTLYAKITCDSKSLLNFNVEKPLVSDRLSAIVKAFSGSVKVDDRGVRILI